MGSAATSLLKPMLKSWPHRLTAVLSRATQLVVVDFESLATEFDVEPAGRLHVEGQHLVVDVPAERRRHRHLAAQRTVQAQPDVVGFADLDHQMHDAARRLRPA